MPGDFVRVMALPRYCPLRDPMAAIMKILLGCVPGARKSAFVTTVPCVTVTVAALFIRGVHFNLNMEGMHCPPLLNLSCFVSGTERM